MPEQKQCVEAYMSDPLDPSSTFKFYFPRHSNAHKLIVEHNNGMESELSRDEFLEIIKDRIPECDIEGWDCISGIGEIYIYT